MNEELTTKQAAQMAKVSTATIYRFVAAGKLKPRNMYPMTFNSDDIAALPRRYGRPKKEATDDKHIDQ